MPDTVIVLLGGPKRFTTSSRRDTPGSMPFQALARATAAKRSSVTSRIRVGPAQRMVSLHVYPDRQAPSTSCRLPEGRAIPYLPGAR